MKKYIEPEIELIKFSVSDVILASGVGNNNTESTTLPDWGGYYGPHSGRQRY